MSRAARACAARLLRVGRKSSDASDDEGVDDLLQPRCAAADNASNGRWGASEEP